MPEKPALLKKAEAFLLERRAEFEARREEDTLPLTPPAEIRRRQALAEEQDQLNHIPDGVRQSIGGRVKEVRTD